MATAASPPYRQGVKGGGGLAGAVGTDEAEHLALGDGEGEVVQRDHVAVAAGQALEFQHVAATRSRPDVTVPAAR
jgi:hypothetical protein